MEQGKLISIEGIEGAGKSTALKFIQDHLEKAGKKVVLTREPGGTKMAEEIRELLLRPTQQEPVSLDAELLLMFAGRAQHLHHVVRPALQAGKWVVSDRYIDASYAYQGGGRKIPMEKIAMLDQWIVDDTYPSLTILMDVTPETGILRADRRGLEKDRIEQEKIDFFIRVRDVYLERAKQDPKRIQIINANEPIYAVESQLHEVLDRFLKR